jgi:cell division transport system permease protein
MARAHPQRRRQLRIVRLARAWLEQQADTAAGSLGQLLRSPLATLMTVGAIAIALALPAMLYLMVLNLEQLSGNWERSAAITLFLAPEIDEARATELAATLQAQPDIARVEVVSRDQGLVEFREYSGLGGALDQLQDNPLPVVLALYPADDTRGESALDGLVQRLEALPEGDFARLDTLWAQRLQAIVGLLRNAALLLGAALCLAVLLVVGNTIRLEIENRRGEVMIMDLVGATRAFVRRPFLYSGAWYGLLGGLLAWLLVTVAIALLQGPVSRLGALYHSDYHLQGLDQHASLLLMMGSMLLGMLGSWIAVGRHMHDIRPG